MQSYIANTISFPLISFAKTKFIWVSDSKVILDALIYSWDNVGTSLTRRC